MPPKYEGMKVLEIDIETAPHLAYVWGLFKENIPIQRIVKPGYTLCFAAKWQHKKPIIFRSVYHHGHDKMVKALWDLLDEADAVVHFNGKKFDIPTINKEFVLMGLVPPTTYKQIDLYHVVRRNFRFASNKLDYVCQQLGIGSKVQHKGMELWTACMNKEPWAWKMMKQYNIGDVHPLLSDLYTVLTPWIPQHPNRGLYVKDATDPTCPNCGSQSMRKKGIETTRVVRYQRYKCNDCGTNARSRLRLDKSGPGILT